MYVFALVVFSGLGIMCIARWTDAIMRQVRERTGMEGGLTALRLDRPCRDCGAATGKPGRATGDLRPLARPLGGP